MPFDSVGNVPMVSARVGAALAFAASLTFGQEPDPVVRANAPDPRHPPSDEFIAAIYAAAERGGRLYDAGRYAEAVPHLTAAAERGLKVPQASLGDILLNGRGGVPRDTEAGIGWLGVAAEPETLSRIEAYFGRVVAQLPPDYRPTASQIVDRYAALYSNHRHRVACRLYGDVVEDLRCLFVDDRDDTTGAGDVEEMIVTAPVISVPEPEFGQMPGGQFISQVYEAYSRGADLYKEKRYKEALPFLVAAAKRGFKWAQASAADIYLHGRGGVPVDLEAGIGWLGVAAEPRTAHSIVEFYEESRALLPARYTPEAVDEIVETYRAQYANDQHRVACRTAFRSEFQHSHQERALSLHRYGHAVPFRRDPGEHSDVGVGMSAPSRITFARLTSVARHPSTEKGRARFSQRACVPAGWPA